MQKSQFKRQNERRNRPERTQRTDLYQQPKAAYRNLALHRAALAKLESNPQLLRPVLALLDRWLKNEAQQPSWPHLFRGRALLAENSFQEMDACVLDPEEGQVLRQCSPLGPVLDPRVL